LNVFFFIFQAEDGIRDFHVTGVQTCALPICLTTIRQSLYESGIKGGELLLEEIATHPESAHSVVLPTELVVRDTTAPPMSGTVRSEERRVGKEYRNRCLPDNAIIRR